MAGSGVAGLRGDDGSLGALSAEAIPQDGQLVQRLRLDVAGLTAQEQRDHATGGHHVDLVGDAAVPQHLVPAHHGAADHIVEDPGIHAGLVGVQLQHAAHIPQPRSGMQIPEAEGYLLIGDDVQLPDKVDARQLPQGGLVDGVPRSALALHGVPALHGQGWGLPVLRG